MDRGRGRGYWLSGPPPPPGSSGRGRGRGRGGRGRAASATFDGPPPARPQRGRGWANSRGSGGGYGGDGGYGVGRGRFSSASNGAGTAAGAGVVGTSPKVNAVEQNKAKEAADDTLVCTEKGQSFFSSLCMLGHEERSSRAGTNRMIGDILLSFLYGDRWCRSDDSRDDNPYHLVLSVAKKMPGFHSKKSSQMAVALIQLFEQHLAENPDRRIDFQGRFLTPAFQLEVLRASVRMDSLSLRRRIYTLCRMDAKDNRTTFHGFVAQRLMNGDFKVALETSHLLGMHQDAELDHIALAMPMLLLESNQLVEDYLVLTTHQVKSAWLRQLDALVGDGNLHQVSELFRHYLGDASGKKGSANRLHGKPLNKMIDKFLKQFEMEDLKAEVAPRSDEVAKRAALTYMVSTKDMEATRLENWRDLVFRQVSDNLNLQAQLLEQLSGGRNNLVLADLDEAVYWARRLQVPEKRLPYAVQQEMSRQESDPSANGSEENWDGDLSDSFSSSCRLTPAQSAGAGWSSGAGGDAGASQRQYYRLRDGLGAGDACHVTTAEEFDWCLSSLEKTHLAGLDSEFGSWNETISLLQIASAEENRIFLLDVPALLDENSRDRIPGRDWLRLKAFFTRRDAVKLGYGIRHDLQLMAKSFPEFRGIEESADGVLDMEIFHKRLSVTVPLDQGHSDARGLSGLVESLFGVPLDKRDQMSDWDKRPLTEFQVYYAMLDAQVLIDIYNELWERSGEKDLQGYFTTLQDNLIKCKNRSKKDKSKPMTQAEKDELKRLNKERKDQLSNPEQFKPVNEHEIESRDLRVVCDNMLEGLCKKLRLYGVDAVCIDQLENYEACVTIARDDDRAILTRSVQHCARFRRLHDKPEHCLMINQSSTEGQIEETFRYFNVNAASAREAMFSRCSLCNSAVYLTMTGEQLRELKASQVRKMSRMSTAQTVFAAPDSDEEDDEDDYDFGGYSDQAGAGNHDEWESSHDANCWMHVDGGQINRLSLCTREGVALKLEGVAEGVARQQETFYACAKCGQIFWKGSHWNRFQNKKK